MINILSSKKNKTFSLKQFILRTQTIVVLAFILAYTVIVNYYFIGSIQWSPEDMRSEISDIHEQQYKIGYDCVFVEGEESSESYTKTFFANF